MTNLSVYLRGGQVLDLRMDPSSFQVLVDEFFRDNRGGAVYVPAPENSEFITKISACFRWEDVIALRLVEQ